MTSLSQKNTANYLKFVPFKLGDLIDLKQDHLKDGITRIVNGLEGKTFFPPSLSSRDL